VEIAAMSKIKNGPITDTRGNRRWYLNDKEHRIDGPAIEYVNGNNYWYLNDSLHRTDGPAAEFADGYRGWWLNGKEYSFEEYIVKANWSDEQIIMWKLLQ
jgi:hypothetical protein